MRHFVQYHNEEIMGPAERVGFGILTKKTSLQKGDTVWLIVGRGKPRQYLLWEMFVVDKILPLSSKRFKFSVTGIDGLQIKPAIAIGNLPWFQDLLKMTGNFRFGLQRIRNEEVIWSFRHASQL